MDPYCQNVKELLIYTNFSYQKFGSGSELLVKTVLREVRHTF